MNFFLSEPGMAESLLSSPDFSKEHQRHMTTRHYALSNNGLTRTVTCVDQVGSDAVLLFTDFDLNDRLLKQVRFEHLDGRLANALYTRFGDNGNIEEQWVFLYDASGKITETYGFDDEGNLVEQERSMRTVC